jgi:hypothetical protein
MEDIEIVGEKIDSVKVPFKLDVSLEAQRLLDKAIGR